MLQLMYSFHGHTPPREFLDAVRRGEAGAFCLFAYNVESPVQLRAFTEQIHAAAREGGQLPPIIGIDQEGGQLMAVSEGVTALPGNMALGATRSPELAEAAGRVLGTELLAMGVNLDFAPSVDVNNNPLNPVVGARSFGDDPILVSDLARALIRGMQSTGVIATAKHFPGHGDTTADSHHAVPVVHHPRERLDALELHPFRAVTADGVGAVLSAHVVYDALDPDMPATLSRRIMTDLLRDELGYDGLALTDAMDMHAVSSRGLVSIREALDAGNDLILLGHLPEQLALGRALNHSVPQATADRITKARARLPQALPSLDVLGCAEHRAIAQRIADAAITLVRGALPLRLDPESRVYVVTPEPRNLTPADTSSAVTVRLDETIAARHANTRGLVIPFSTRLEDLPALLAELESADVVIVGTIVAERDPVQAELVRAIHARGQRLIVVSLRTPYDISAFPMVETYLCAYGIREHSTEAVARALFGELTPTGTLPCAIPNMTSPTV